MSKKILLFVLFGFLLNILISSNYIYKLNSYETVDTDDNFRHNLIKGINENHWNKAYKLKEDINSGKIFFISGDIYNRNYLPSIVFYIYSIFTGDDLYEVNNGNLKITDSDKKLFLLIFQSALFSLSIIFLINVLKNYLTKNILLILAIFFSIEPTINQWHSSFFSGSIFLSLQIILLSLLLRLDKKYLSFFLIGILSGLLFAQRSAAIFYFVIIFIYFLIFLEKKKFKKIIIYFFSYLICLSFILTHNYLRSGVAYLTPLDQRTALFHYFEPEIISKKENISFSDAKKKLSDDLIIWKTEKKLNLENEKDLIIYLDEKKKRSIKTILSNPTISAKIVLKKTFHSGLLDPVYVYFFSNTEYEGKNPYYKSDLHAKIVKFRFFYSIFIYIFSIIGFYIALKNLKMKFIFISCFSYFYFLMILGWMGSTRYYTACLPYILIFFSIGINTIFNRFFPKINLNDPPN